MKVISLVLVSASVFAVTSVIAEEIVVINDVEYDRSEFVLDHINPRRPLGAAERQRLRDEHAATFVAASVDGNHVLNHDDRSGLVTIAGGKFSLKQSAADVRRDRRAAAEAFIREHLTGIGLRGKHSQLIYRGTKKDNMDYHLTTFRQQFRGVPILFGEVRVQFSPDDATVSLLVSNIDPDISVDTVPTIRGKGAVARTKAYYAAQFSGQSADDLVLVGGKEKLLLYSAELFELVTRDRLVWVFNLALENEDASRKFVVDAHSGEVLTEIPLEHDIDRRVVVHGNSSTLRTETSAPSTDSRVNAVWTMLGDIYDHFLNVHSWQSYDDSDGTIDVTLKHPQLPGNAIYLVSSDRLVFGWGMDEVDIVAHEFTHAVTRHTANLFYINMSGAIDESMGDIWGAILGGNWLIGETSIRGAIRDMANPASVGPTLTTGRPLPDHISKYECLFTDNGGVHINSSIINKAAHTLWLNTGMNDEKTSKVFFRSLESCLLPTASFTQLRDCATVMGNQLGVGSATVLAFNTVGLYPASSNPVCVLAPCVAVLYIPPPDPDVTELEQEPNVADLLYRVRDDAWAGTTFGDRYTNMYYAHADALEATLLANPGLFTAGGDILAQATPGLMGMFGFTTTEPVVTQQFVDDTVAFFQGLANATTDVNLRNAINLELFYLSRLNTLVGKTYAQAWAQFPNAWYDPFCCIGP